MQPAVESLRLNRANTEPDSDLSDILHRLDARITQILELLLNQKTIKDWYSTAEAAEVLGKAEFTVREWCRHGRINAAKRRSGRGEHCSWVISHAELLRYQREGLLPFATSNGRAAQ